jgi:hypothetical protein
MGAIRSAASGFAAALLRMESLDLRLALRSETRNQKLKNIFRNLDDSDLATGGGVEGAFAGSLVGSRWAAAGLWVCHATRRFDEPPMLGCD